jgi:hypothetical protein
VGVKTRSCRVARNLPAQTAAFALKRFACRTYRRTIAEDLWPVVAMITESAAPFCAAEVTYLAPEVHTCIAA